MAIYNTRNWLIIASQKKNLFIKSTEHDFNPYNSILLSSTVCYGVLLLCVKFLSKKKEKKTKKFPHQQHIVRLIQTTTKYPRLLLFTYPIAKTKKKREKNTNSKIGTAAV